MTDNMKGSRYQAVIFDLDGTLLNTLEDLALSLNYALTAHGYPTHDMEAVRRFVGNGIEKLVRRGVPQGTEESQVQAVLTAFKAHYALHKADHTRPYDGILDMLGQLRDRAIRLAVVSNKNDENVKALCRAYFGLDTAIGDAPDRPPKPAPEGTWLAMAQLGATPEQTLYVGDSDVDVATARNAGIDCLAVTWGFRTREELLEAGAISLADKPEEIIRVVMEA